ncbi:hypothetical protein QNH46_08975 [Paenibacillus woosongensis]|uniref:Uncharacterized protein n=1 Tax=Paenibacillus woosongensis TaxID=307580 RepID=A0AA95I571_9BACL|nr:hypothetical protein [Paenibacillus woosongensis]WHX50759.1 hypothetical protein QNH46_08975 [Paenibacillus woosongensis]
MKWNSQAGMALGFLAGTTFGSGIGFLLHWHSYDLVAIVSACGVIGTAAGVWTVRRVVRGTPNANKL